MTPLERLVSQSVTASAATTLNRTAEKLGEELAAELLRDPDFRAWMKQFARAAFGNTLTHLTTPERTKARRRTKKGRADA